MAECESQESIDADDRINDHETILTLLAVPEPMAYGARREEDFRGRDQHDVLHQKTMGGTCIPHRHGWRWTGLTQPIPPPRYWVRTMAQEQGLGLRYGYGMLKKDRLWPAYLLLAFLLDLSADPRYVFLDIVTDYLDLLLYLARLCLDLFIELV